MSEKYVTYTELKLPAGKKKTHRESESCKKKTQKEKKEEKLVYSELKILPPNANQTKKTKAKSSKQKVAGPSVPVAWRLAVVVLGIICSGLLVILGFMVLQVRSTGQSQKPFLSNRTRENCTCKKEESKEEKKPSNTGSEGRDMCKIKWSCCEDKCYYISQDEKNFEESRKACKKLSSTLVKFEDEKEMKFIQKQLSYFSWIGLSREGIGSSWTWEDNSKPNSKIIRDWKEKPEGNCVNLSTKKMDVTNCFMERNYICERKTACFAT